MQVSYKKLFKLLIDNDLKKTEFAKKIGIGQNTLAKLSKNEYVSMEVLAKICKGLNCKIEDIVEFIDD
ncbi:transcriptional regulator [Faecalitalea cylindroides]|uniref:Transcriptional regulator n=1 Tax=Faecalitalea cylindroides TaxID=39483 RepID=A0A1Y4LPW4_9FIRM|nr:helix-turn-helix transcriptional regulator [Faecalitalea cylindroides]OUP57579.1 transcriptional regulator [Faecalitalea cylindroides]